LKPTLSTKLIINRNYKNKIKVNYLEVVFTSDGRWSEENDTQIIKAKAVMCGLYHSVVTK